MIESLFPGGKGGDDEKVKVSSNDTTAGFLNGKLVAGTNVTLTEGSDGGDETLTIASADTNDAVKVSSNDTTPGDLEAKLVAGTNITLTTNNDGSNETLTITSADTNDAVKVSSNDTTPGDLEAKLVAGTNITLTTNNDGSNETLTIDAAAGGLTAFVESQNTASPNNTVNASRLLVDATSTDADAVIEPKGNGALLAELPDGTATGGNKRGIAATDFQRFRASSSQVASGTYGFIVGASNTSSGDYSVCLGLTNIASTKHAVAIGASNTASGANNGSFAYGSTNTASGELSVALGFRNTSSGKYSFAMGADAVADKYAKRAFAPLRWFSSGDMQEEKYVLVGSTTNGTPKVLTTDANNQVSSNSMTIDSDATYTFKGLVTARRTDADNESAGYKIEGVIDNNAGTTAFVGTPTVTILGEDTAAWDVVVEADDTNDALVIKVTGEAGKTIRWGATVELMKVKG